MVLVIGVLVAGSIGSRFCNYSLYSKADDCLNQRKTLSASVDEMRAEGYSMAGTAVVLAVKTISDGLLLHAAYCAIAPLLSSLLDYVAPVISAIKRGLSDPMAVFRSLWQWGQGLNRALPPAILHYANAIRRRVNQLFQQLCRVDDADWTWDELRPLIWRACKEQGAATLNALWSMLYYVCNFFFRMLVHAYEVACVAVRYLLMDVGVYLLEMGFVLMEVFEAFSSGRTAQQWATAL